MNIGGLHIDSELLIAMIIAVIFSIRQEGRITRSIDRLVSLEQRMSNVEGRHEALSSEITKSLRDLQVAVARIETTLLIKQEKDMNHGS